MQFCKTIAPRSAALHFRELLHHEAKGYLIPKLIGAMTDRNVDVRDLAMKFLESIQISFCKSYSHS
jgi:hypothetical protein